MYGDRNFLFLLGSSRADGNTAALAARAAASLPADVEQRWISLDDYPLAAFEDLRYAGVGPKTPAGNERFLLDATLDATDIVIASPLYWYTVSASTKLYLDYWSGWMRLPGVRFKARMSAKTLWGVTVLGDREPEVAEPLVETLRLSAAYLGMRWGGVLRGNGSRPGQVLDDTAAMRRAAGFFDVSRVLVGGTQ